MKDMTWLKTSIIAHRGFHTKAFPENSMEAFNNATKNGYDIEFDLQFTKDNQIVIIHDHKLKRLCGIDKKVSELTYNEIKDLKLKNTNSSIPLFTDLLATLPLKTNLMIELKTGKKNKLLVSTFLSIIKDYDFNFVVQSFDPRIVYHLKRLAPHISRGYIVKNKQVPFPILNTIIKLLPIHTVAKPDYYIYKIDDLPNKKMDKMKSKGIPVLSYTAKTKKQLQYIKGRYDNAVFEGFNPKK